jgi:hypothetical protein
MSFIYPRTIQVSRANETTPAQVGNIGYNGVTGPTNETVIASDVCASIQLANDGVRNAVGLPSDAPSRPVWKLLIPASALALGTIRSADIITDDIGQRYVIQSPYWNSLGYACRMTTLEV